MSLLPAIKALEGKLNELEELTRDLALDVQKVQDMIDSLSKTLEEKPKPRRAKSQKADDTVQPPF